MALAEASFSASSRAVSASVPKTSVELCVRRKPTCAALAGALGGKLPSAANRVIAQHNSGLSLGTSRVTAASSSVEAGLHFSGNCFRAYP